jgi:hypothetical protein
VKLADLASEAHAAVINAYDEGFKAARARERSTKETLEDVFNREKNRQEDVRYVKTPWGLLDRYAQLFVAT